MTVPSALSPVPKRRYFDANGQPLVGGKEYWYLTGTVVPEPVYTDHLRTIAHTHPIVLDAEGYAPPVYISPVSYKVVVTDADDVVLHTVDPVFDSGILLQEDIADGTMTADLAWTQAGTGATARTVASKLQDTVSVRDWGMTGDGVTEISAEFQQAVDEIHARGGGVLYVDPGTYVLNGAAPIMLYDNTTIQGVRGASIIEGGAAGKVLFINEAVDSVDAVAYRPVGATWTTTRNRSIALKGLSFTGLAARAFVFAGCDDLEVSDCEFRSAGVGALGYLAAGEIAGAVSQFRFERNIVIDCMGGIGVRPGAIGTVGPHAATEGVQHVIIADNVFYHASAGLVGSQILVETYWGNLYDVQITGNLIGADSTGGTDFIVAGIDSGADSANAHLTGLTITRNHVKSLNADDLEIGGIRIDNDGATTQLRGVTVSDNVVACQRYGIRTTDAVTGLKVTGNMLADCVSAGKVYTLYLADCLDALVQGNVIDCWTGLIDLAQRDHGGIWAPESGLVSGNVIRNGVGGAGIYSPADSGSLVISGNLVDDINGAGIATENAGTSYVSVTGNRISNCLGAGIRLQTADGGACLCSGNVVKDNAEGITWAVTGIASFIEGNLLDGNTDNWGAAAVAPTDVELATRNNMIDGYLCRYRDIKETWDAAAPGAGTWAVGDIVWNTTPAATDYMGWVCVTAGTPGTWKGFGAIEA